MAASWILLQALAQPIDVAERRGLEDVEVGVGGQQRVGRGAIEPVARQHQRRDAVSSSGARERRVRRRSVPSTRSASSALTAAMRSCWSDRSAWRRSRSTLLGAATNIRPVATSMQSRDDELAARVHTAPRSTCCAGWPRRIVPPACLGAAPLRAVGPRLRWPAARSASLAAIEGVTPPTMTRLVAGDGRPTAWSSGSPIATDRRDRQGPAQAQRGRVDCCCRGRDRRGRHAGRDDRAADAEGAATARRGGPDRRVDAGRTARARDTRTTRERVLWPPAPDGHREESAMRLAGQGHDHHRRRRRHGPRGRADVRGRGRAGSSSPSTARRPGRRPSISSRRPAARRPSSRPTSRRKPTPRRWSTTRSRPTAASTASTTTPGSCPRRTIR